MSNTTKQKAPEIAVLKLDFGLKNNQDQRQRIRLVP